MSSEIKREGEGLSAQFKRFVFVLVTSLTCYRIIFSLFAPNAWHVPDEVLLVVLVCLLGFMWTTQEQVLARLSKSEKALRDAQLGVLSALIEAVEAKDAYTRGHSEQVRRLAVELAKKSGLSEVRVGVVGRAAILHDLGKIETPDAILHKEGPLSDEEYDILKKHPIRTGTILSKLDFLSEEVRIAVFHHERCDGKGYGAGLEEGQVPIESFIIGIADTFDAMNSDRPYRTKIPKEKILEELKKGRGVQHPAELVDKFLELLKERPELWVRMTAS